MAFACLDILKAIGVRLVLLIHSLLAVWRVVIIAEDNFYWWFAIVDVALVLEGIVTIIARKGMEYKWFCPCFLIYLGGTVPAIWLLELDRRDRFIQNLEQEVNSSTKSNKTEISTTSGYISSATPVQTKEDTSLTVYGVTISVPLELAPDTWVVIIEQLLLYFMILGRWVLPRGKVSRNELSQLLFVFIGMASDITELFALFDEVPVRKSIDLTYVILTMWSVSLLQFCFVLTATKNPNRPRVALRSNKDIRKKFHCSTCYSTELWSIFVLMLMQDLPFLVIRTYTIVTFNLITYSIIFFTAKNVLIVVLLIYRVAVICFVRKDDDKDQEEEKHQSLPKSKNEHSFNGNKNFTGISVIEHNELQHQRQRIQQKNNMLMLQHVHNGIPNAHKKDIHQMKRLILKSHKSKLVNNKCHVPKQYLYNNGASLGSL